MLVLGIESSCDETGLALYDTRRGLLAHALHSQIAMHRAYGGVVPELASRDHIRRALPLLETVLAQTGIARGNIDAIAYTQGPGLAGALLVGASLANALALAWQRPVIGIHHLEGHLLSPLLAPAPPSFPFVALLVSGGHTQLMRVADVGVYETLGETLDDAAGEAFDKTAKLLGLSYPGGPEVSRLAQSGTPGAINLPRPMLHSGDLDFSFSGLKTAVLTQVKRLGLDADPGVNLDVNSGTNLDAGSGTNSGMNSNTGAGPVSGANPGGDSSAGSGANSGADSSTNSGTDPAANPNANFDAQARADIARGFVDAAVDVLTAKSLAALRRTGLRRLVVAGGVGANQQLRAALSAAATRHGFNVHYPDLALCTDNGAMIALAGALRIERWPDQATRDYAFTVKPRWDLATLAHRGYAD